MDLLLTQFVKITFDIFHGGKENLILLGYHTVFCLALLPMFHRNSYLHLHSITLKMVVVFFSEALVTSYDHVWCHTPESLPGTEKKSSSLTSLHLLYDTINIIIITAYNNNKNNNNSIEFSGYLLTCWLKDTSAYRTASKEKQIERKNSVNTQRQNTNQTKTIWPEESNIKSTGEKALNPEKTYVS